MKLSYITIAEEVNILYYTTDGIYIIYDFADRIKKN